MLPAFFYQNLHFALSIFASMVFSWCFWLYFDVWLARKTLRESLKFLGFLFLSVSFLLHSFHLESNVFSIQFIEITLYTRVLFVTRIIGYLLIALGTFLEPNLTRPQKKPILTAFAIAGFKIPVYVISSFSLPILASVNALLFLYKSTIGLEFHLRKVAIAFFGLSIYELLSLRELFENTSNVAVFNLVAPLEKLWWIEHLVLGVSVILLGKWVFSYLLKRLQSQLYIFFSLTILLIFIISTLSFTALLLGNIQKEALKQLEVNANVFNYALESKKSELISDTETFAQNADISTKIATDQKQQLAKLASNFLVSKRLRTLVIVNADGQVIARGEDPDRIGESLSGNQLFKRALKDQSQSSLLTLDGVLGPEVLISAGSPIKSKGEIVGIVITGLLIDNAFIDGLQKTTGLTTSIYGDTKISATTITAEDGITRRVGIIESNKDIISKVTGTGETYVGKNQLLNTPYFTAYVPLKDINDVPVGMLFVGKPQLSVFETAGRSIQASFIVAGVLWLFAIIPSYLISLYISKQLH